MLLWLATVLGVIGSLLLVLAVHRSLLPYNSEGNYFDGGVNYSQQSVLVFSALSIAFLATAAILFGFRFLGRRAQQGIPADAASSRRST